MNAVLRWGAIALLVVLAAVALALLAGALRWRAATRELRARVEAGRLPQDAAPITAAELEALPAPVRRYLARALPEGARRIESATLRQSGEMNLAQPGEPARWLPFTAEHRVVTRRPGFLWDARVRMAPGLRAHVHDAYASGEGRLHASLAGLWTVAREQGTPEMAEGELLRWLAEAVWYPTVLVAGGGGGGAEGEGGEGGERDGVRWEAVDQRKARAVVVIGGGRHASREDGEDGPARVELVFRFGEDGLVEGVRAESRARAVNGGYERQAWEGRFWDYAERGGVLVPLMGEVAWVEEDGAQPYWRGRIEDMALEWAE